MQELDVQNTAAAEQHLKDMADYEVKLTEAAAAWEADRKKKKGKAKDEVSHHCVLLVQKGTVAKPHAYCVAVLMYTFLQNLSKTQSIYRQSICGTESSMTPLTPLCSSSIHVQTLNPSCVHTQKITSVVCLFGRLSLAHLV